MTKLDQGNEFAKFQTRGGVMDGDRLTAEKVKEISKWPNRQQQLAILLGQILSPGAKLLSQINAPGGALASQIKKKSEGEDGEVADASADAASASTEAADASADAADASADAADASADAADASADAASASADSAEAPQA
jgi:hypothetical protein